MCSGDACFAAGTMLMTPYGQQAIETFQVGDLLTSRNEHEPDGELESKSVEAIFRRSAPITHVRAAGQAIRTTDEHPFYAYNKGWTQANLLQAGDRLLSHDGQ